jgi:hypothetical protein
MHSARPSSAHIRARRSAALLCCLAVAVTAALGTGCSTRTSRDRIVNRYGLDVHLESERKMFGKAIDQGYAHPSDITVQRLEIILGSLEIERRERARTVIGPAIPAEILRPISQGLAEGFREADSTQHIAVIAMRKQRQKAIFHREFLTTLVAFMEGEDLVIHLSRSDWPVPDQQRNLPQQNQRTNVPFPGIDDPQEKFRVATNEFVRRSGRSGVAVDWQSDVFNSFASARVARAAPATGASAGSSDGAGGKTTVLMAEPEEPLPEIAPLTSEQIERLSPDDLRSLADLEEARTKGVLTEGEFRRKRQAILDASSGD